MTSRQAALMGCATAVTLTLFACHAGSRPAVVPALPDPPAVSAPPPLPVPPTPPALTQLHRDIDAILGQAALERGYWGVLVRSLQTDEILYALNPRKLMMPASNLKIVTLAAAAERLGWDYTYETQILGVGAIDSGTLDGDLLVIGSGDPSLVVADGMSGRVFDAWAERLKEIGVRSILGRLIGDDNTFDDDELGFGWSWDDLPDDYAAGVSALQFNENAARVTVSPGTAVGDPASVVVAPAGSGLVIHNMLKTGAAKTSASIAAHRFPGSAHLELRGSIPLDATPMTRSVSVANPTLFLVNALRDALIARGIDVGGPAVDIDEIDDPPKRSDGVALVTYRSPPLSALAVRLMKVSQNMYAETFLKTIGAVAGAPTFGTGWAAAQTALQSWGVTAQSLILRDGSGLSRYSYVTAEALVTILMHIDRNRRLRERFEATLPIAGRDGTLANRMKGTAAEGNTRAKTGSMSNVRALSGYVTSGDGEPLVFSILANNFEAPADVVNHATDEIVVRLATFRR